MRIRALCVLSLLSIGCSAGFSESVTVVESSQGFLFQENGQDILFYQRSPKSYPGGVMRSHFIHPLWSLDGDVLTEDTPADHLHHHGVFWAWHQTYVGTVRCGDAWEGKRFIWEVVEAQTAPIEGARKLDVTVLWKSPDFVDGAGSLLPIVREQSTVTVHPRGETVRLIDFEMRLLALQDDVSIGGSEDVKGYGGFSLRLRLPEDLSFHAQEKTVTPRNEAVQAGNWLDFNATFNPEVGRSGVAVFVHPDNPGATDQWILRQARSMQNPVFPGRTPVPISRTDPTVLKYRVVIHKGATADVPLAEMYQAYIGSR